MGIFSTIVGAVAGPVLGKVFGDDSAEKERKQSRRDARLQFSRLRAAAERGGFNPLTALQATGTAGFNNLPSGSLAPLATSRLVSNAVSGVVDVATGDKARRDAAVEASTRLNEIQAESLDAAGAAKIAQRTKTQAARVPAVKSSPVSSPESYRPPKVGPNGTSNVPNFGYGPFEVGTVPDAGGTVQTQPDRKTVEHVGPLSRRYTTAAGNTITMPVADDPEEIVSGAVTSWTADNQNAIERLGKAYSRIPSIITPSLPSVPSAWDMLNSPIETPSYADPPNRPKPLGNRRLSDTQAEHFRRQRQMMTGRP
jgi:hypothetical protein